MLKTVVFTLLLCGATAVYPAPKVIASIVPVHSLVAAIMQGVGEPQLLLRGGASPHDYALRPSDMRALNSAAVVFWVGAVLETSLAKAIRNMNTMRAVSLLDTPGLKRLPLREGGLWEAHEHEHAVAEDLAINPHIWLDPGNAWMMLEHIAAVLGEIDPANNGLYQRNKTVYQDRLSVLSTQLEDQLAIVRTKPYIVFHDAYPYFEQRFGLQPAGSITLNPERAPGAKRVQQIRARIVAGEIRCVFAEPQFRPALVDTLIADTASRAGVLDPLGMNLTPGPDAYLQLLQALADSILDCLQN